MHKDRNKPRVRSIDSDLIVQEVCKFIKKHGLLEEGSRVLVACSGGPDSVALADILRTLGYSIGLAHMNYGMRGADSEADAQLVEQLAQQWNVPFHSIKAHRLGFDAHDKANFQERARDIRYRWLQQVRQDENYDKIATAHQLDDQVETILMRLFRGTSLKGLVGIPPSREDIIRPLLCIPRAMIVEYLQQKNLPYRIDHTNLTEDYLRNRIRHRILPTIQAVFPAWDRAIRLTSSHLVRQYVLFRALWEERVYKIVRPYLKGYYLPRSVLEKSLTGHAQELWEEILHWLGFSAHQMEEIGHYGDHHPGQTFHNNKWTLYVERTGWVFLPHDFSPQWSKQVIHGPGVYQTRWGTVEVHALKSDEKIPQSPSTIVLSPDDMAQPLVLRPRQKGDVIFPVGWSSGVRLKKLLTNVHYPTHQKSTAPVLTDAEGNILWVPGVRVSSRLKSPSAPNRWLLKWLPYFQE